MRTITEEQAAEGLEKVFGIPKCPKCGSIVVQIGIADVLEIWHCRMCTFVFFCGHSEKVKHDWNDSFPKYLGEKVKT